MREEKNYPSLDDAESIPHGRHGFQNETGFDIQEIRFIPVMVVRCSSDEHPTPQDRFVSPWELEQSEPELEVADHVFGVRIEGEVIIGRTDDIAEVAKQHGIGHARKLTVRSIGKALNFLGKVAQKLKRVFPNL